MSSNTELAKTTVELEVLGVRLKLATTHRPGEGVPILFLHGFGSTKEDYADIVLTLRMTRQAVVKPSVRIWTRYPFHSWLKRHATCSHTSP
jgi:predicted esterase